MARTKDTADAPKEKKAGRTAQFRQLYKVTKAADPKIPYILLGIVLATTLAFYLLGRWIGLWPFYTFFGVLIGVLLAMIVLARRAERAAYAQIAGQPGAVGAALGSIRRGWYIKQEPVAADVQRAGDINNAAMVYRALGRPGVVLVGEGPAGRAAKLLATEKKKVERVAPGVPVTTVLVGEGEGAIPLPKVARHVQKLKNVLTKEEMALVNKRLGALGGVRPPIPKGVDPTRARMDRRALKGR